MLAVTVDNEDAQMLQEEAVERFEKTLSALDDSLDTIRTGRANPKMLDKVVVDYYGAPTPLNQLAGVSTPDASTLVVQVFDMGAMAEVEKAIQSSDLGLTPNNDGKVIRLNIPALTQERRKEMAKGVGKMGEESKVAIRNVRRDTLKEYQKVSACACLCARARERANVRTLGCVPRYLSLARSPHAQTHHHTHALLTPHAIARADARAGPAARERRRHLRGHCARPRG